MIVSKTVQLKWGARNYKHLVDKGYVFTGMHDEVIVDVRDLMHGCYSPVLVKCEECGKIWEESFYRAIRQESRGNMCMSCILRREAQNRRDNLVKNRGSFIDACISKFGADFLEKYWSDKNTIDPSEITVGHKAKVWIKCQDVSYHEDYQTLCTNLLNGCKCPQCGRRHAIHPKDSFGAEIDKKNYDGYSLIRWSSKNDFTPYDYSPQSGKKVWFTCPTGKHSDYKQSIVMAYEYNCSCKQCARERNKSNLQGKVERYIKDKYGFTMLHEEFCSLHPKNPETGSFMRYDIEIANLNIIIEVNGQQHYKPCSWQSSNEMLTNDQKQERLHLQQQRDLYKKDYAISHGYMFLEIPYWTEKTEEYKTIIDNAFTSATQKVVGV